MRWISVGVTIVCCVSLAACSEATPSTASPTSSFTSTSSAIPAGWKTVTYEGLGIDVPRAWLVERWRLTCGVAMPTVFIGPAQPLAMNCVADPPQAALVVLGALPVRAVKSIPTELNGIRADLATQYEVYHGNLGATIADISVSLPSANVTISVSVGESSAVPGGARGRAEQIVNTIHHVP
jgi:hypothetical protein